MSPPQLSEDRHRTDAGGGFQHRHDLAFPHASERVGAPPLARPFGTAPRIGLDPLGSGGAEPSLRGGDGWRSGLTGLHVQPRLAVGDVSARHALLADAADDIVMIEPRRSS
jgi:hypothetical protein